PSPGPSTIPASASAASAVPASAGRQPRKRPTASTIVNASTHSTPEARNAERTTSGLIVDPVVEHAGRVDPDDHAVGRRVERLPLVPVRKLVDVLAGAVLVELGRALDLEVLVRVV